jgi:hypothetical protein
MKKTLSVPEKHQRNIALKTLELSEVGAHIMGGMDHRGAVKVLRSFGYSDADIRSRLKAVTHETEAIDRFMK